MSYLYGTVTSKCPQLLTQLLPTRCYQMLYKNNKGSYMCRVTGMSGTLPGLVWLIIYYLQQMKASHCRPHLKTGEVVTSNLPKVTESELWSQDSKLHLLHPRHCININYDTEVTSHDESHQGCQAQSWECALWYGSATTVGRTPHPAMMVYLVCESGWVLACSQRQTDYDFSYEINFWLMTLNSWKGELEVLCARLR